MDEIVARLEGPAHFLDLFYETIDARVHRTGEPYQGITGVSGIDAGDVEHEAQAALQVYVDATRMDREEAYERMGFALDRVADRHNMAVARQGVRIIFTE